MSVSIRGSFLRGLRITTSGDVVPYFLLDNFNGTGTLGSHTGDSGGTWSDPDAFDVYPIPDDSAWTVHDLPSVQAFSFTSTFDTTVAFEGNTGRIIVAAQSQVLSGNGIYISDDDGVTWTQTYTETGTIDIEYTNFVANGNIIMIGDNQGSLYRSTDNGDNWTVSHFFTPTTLQYSRLQLAYNDDFSVLIAVTDNTDGEFYRSTNNGSSWALIANTDLNILHSQPVYFTPIRFDSANQSFYVFDYANLVLYVSADATGATATWTSYTTTNTEFSVTPFPVNPTNNGPLVSNCLQIDTDTWIIIVATTFVTGSPDTGSTTNGLWRFVVDTGNITGTNIANIYLDTTTSGNSYNVPSIGSAILIDGNLILSSGAGYNSNYLLTAGDNTGASTNNNINAFAPYVWKFGLTSFRSSAMNYNVGSNRIYYGTSSNGTISGLISVLSGYANTPTTGSSLTTFIDTVDISGGSANPTVVYQGAAVAQNSLMPPAPDVYVEMDVSLDIASKLFDIAIQLFNSGDGTGMTARVFSDYSDISPDPSQFATQLYLSDSNFIANVVVPPFLYNVAENFGTTPGLHTLRLESISSTNTYNLYVDTVLKISQVYPSGAVGGVGIVSVGSGYTRGTYTNVPLQGGTGTGAEVNLEIAEGSIDTYFVSNGGSGYVDGVYNGVPLTGGTGSNSFATVLVVGGAVTEVLINEFGNMPTRTYGYTVSDVLSASNAFLGGSGSGFQLTVLTVTTYSNTYMANVGSGYTNGDTLTVNNTDVGGTGSGLQYSAQSGTISVPDIFQIYIQGGSILADATVLAVRGGAI